MVSISTASLSEVMFRHFRV